MAIAHEVARVVRDRYHHGGCTRRVPGASRPGAGGAVKVLVVYSHPVEGSFTSALRDRVLAGLNAGGHETRLDDLYADDFRPELSAWERTNHLLPPEHKPEIAAYAANLRWCDALVLVYPTWWSGQPAMLKGWMDRVWVAGVAYDLPEGGNHIRPRLHNIRRIVTVTSHGSSKSINAIQGESGKRVVNRSLRVLCNRYARTRWLALYRIDRCSAQTREAFLAKTERSMQRLR
ncbi:MAG: flavodoxin family protein [Actinobacteria bacterium]|nr:flavodoxin family protein [Actinomycetota bacterium]